MVNRIFVNYSDSEKFVAKHSARGVDVRWEGWDMVFFRPRPGAMFDKKGVFRNGTWGIESRVSSDSRGLWKVPPNYVSL